MDIDENTEVNSTALATVLGLTARRIRQLTQEGIIMAKSRGQYLLCDSVQRYIDFRIRERPMSQAEIEKLDADVSIKKAKAVIMMLEAKELQGKMHRSEDVAALTEDLIYTIRSALIALPGRLAVEVADASSPPETAEIIRQEVYRVMEELSRFQFDAKKYEERVRKRMNWDAAKFDSDDDE